MTRFHFHRRNGSFPGLGTVVSIAAVLLVVLLGCLAVNPGTHELFHADAGQVDHDCVVTTFAAGEASFVAPLIVARPDQAFMRYESAESRQEPRQPVSDFLLPSCGPPASV